VAQKYVNSPDSDIYHKERELYGIYQAKKAIVKEDRVFMVEGYTDVIAMHQAGIENVVANSGTALSTYQIHMLHRFTNNITLLYDGDEAGIHAAMRGTDMLLEEGMNIKVLLLPDGDDPDSFARKHSTEELKQYIEENQTDFITFKSRLTVENVTDPVKRSEAIGGIVKSISVIPDQILRSTYLSDFAHRINMKEQTLIAEMNKFIQKSLEDKGKDSARQQGREQQQEQELSQPKANGDDLLSLQSPTEQASQVEQMLIREIVRHGEEIIFENVETEDGQKINLSVSQYIDFDLSADGLQLASPLYRQILSEAVAHQGEPGFKAETYFCSHPDMQVSQLATKLAIDRHQLGGRFKLDRSEDEVDKDEKEKIHQEFVTRLRQRVLHLVMDYRLDIVESRLKTIQRELLQVGSDRERMMQLLKEHKETKELRDALAKRLGTDLVV
jgi:DNA primase